MTEPKLPEGIEKYIKHLSEGCTEEPCLMPSDMLEEANILRREIAAALVKRDAEWREAARTECNGGYQPTEPDSDWQNCMGCPACRTVARMKEAK